MQSADGLERPVAVTAHDLRQSVQCCSGHHRSGVVHAGKHRGVPVVEKFQSVALGVHHRLDVCAGVEALDLLARGGRAGADLHQLVQPLCRGFAEERALSIDPERMAARESVAAERFAVVQADMSHLFLRSPQGQCRQADAAGRCDQQASAT